MIPLAKPYLSEKEKSNLIDCVDSSWISSAGKFISEFESLNSKYYKCSHAIAVSNGTTALEAALLALGITYGDEVIIPDLTFAATANAVINIGAVPILADVEKDSWNIDIDNCQGLISTRTKAIIPVHLYGLPCNMEKVLQFAKDNKLYIIEDCAECHGAEFKGKKAGTFGDIGCFSFFANKIITCGEGGLCITDNEELNEKIRTIINHGRKPGENFLHHVSGHNFRMTNMQAAIGCAQMENIDSFIKKRDYIEKNYDYYFKENQNFSFQNTPPYIKKVCWLYTLLINKASIKKIISCLKSKDIETRPLFYPLHKMAPYQKFQRNEVLISTFLSNRGLSLPTFYELTEDQIEYIANELLKNI